ncbi:MAG: substrate-binding domain-containing protein [Clostridiales bacterium]|nr:substrate-binding domain-containing protein [Clostridiales bacterium]
MKKRLLALTLCGLLLTACSSGKAPASENTTAAPSSSTTETTSSEQVVEEIPFYLIMPVAGGPAWGLCEDGFMDAIEKYADEGYTGHVLAPATAGNQSEMLEQLEAAIQAGAKVITMRIVSEDMFNDALQRANEAGILVTSVSSGTMKAMDLYAKADAGTDSAGLGRTIAEALDASAPKDVQLNIVTIQPQLTNEQSIVGANAFEEQILKLRPDAVIVSKEECHSLAAEAQDKLSALRLANPELNAVVNFDSMGALGGAAFVAENGLQDSFYCIGIDANDEILTCVKEGTLTCTVAQHWYEMGGELVELARTILNDGEYERQNDTGTTIIYEKDVDAWCEKYGIELN